MRAEVEVHRFIPRVFHLVGDLQGIAAQLVAHGKAEGKGVLRAGLLVVAECKNRAHVGDFRAGKGFSARKPVAIHGVRFIAEAVSAVQKPAAYGEEDGRLPAPDFCVAAPEVFAPRGVFHARNFRTVLLDLYGKFFVFQFDHRFILLFAATHEASLSQYPDGHCSFPPRLRRFIHENLARFAPCDFP